jgi:hypothetical protein
MIMYAVDPTKRTTIKRGEVRIKEEIQRGTSNAHARRATEYKMKMRYPLTVLSAPLVLALPFVVLQNM